MKRDPKSLLWDAREAANAIAAMTSDKSFANFDGDIVLRSAVERQFEILGEAPVGSRDSTQRSRPGFRTCARSSLSATS